ncbi:MAG: ectoine synthase [Bacteriovoracaceae bacterium]|jgi:hypothetical protein|nr:ectoine synthase [Bacteriovoracaceae bacterium]HOE73871.1 ectoine synthase [Deltaproteobacteria bacterium]HPL88011.1 ectoine synthase [Deltaproteobacteria bacterium]
MIPAKKRQVSRCIEGKDEEETVDEGHVYPIVPGTMYALDQNHRHYLRTSEDMRLVCVFNPPLVSGKRTGRTVPARSLTGKHRHGASVPEAVPAPVHACG